MLRNVQLLCAVLMMLLTFNAAAMDLQQAKTAGLIGEQRNGYLGLVSGDAAMSVLPTIVVRGSNRAWRT